MTAGTVPGRLKELADRDPGSLAIEGPDGRITFAGLWESCSALAAVLAEVLAGNDGPRPVAVLVTPDRAGQIEAFGAVLVAGHTPLLLDPRVPGALQQEWALAAGACLVLADHAHAVVARRRFNSVPVVTIDEGHDEPPVDPRTIDPGDPALLVPEPQGADGSITVGSISHADLLRRARADAHRLGLTRADRVATPLPLSSPLGTRAALMGLLTGATTVLQSTRGQTGPAQWLAEAGITVLALNPALVELANAAPPTDVPSLRCAMLLTSATDTGPDLVELSTAPGVPLVVVDDRDTDPGCGAPDDQGGGAPDDQAGEALRRDEDALPEGEPTAHPPEAVTGIEATLVALWEELLGVHPVGLDDDFFALGGHSLLAARLLVLLEQREGVRLPMAVFLETTTIEGLAEAARQSGNPASHPAIIAIQAGDPARAPLFVTHDLQGSAWRFQQLARAVGEDQPVFGCESPMLEGRREFTTIEDLAAHYVDALRTVQATGPYHVCGYSFGGILAFEMALVLRRQGEEVALLGVIDVGPGYRGLDYSRTDHPPLPYLRDAVGEASGKLPRWARPLRRLWLNRWVLARRWQRHLRRGETVPPGERLWFAWWAHWNLVGPQWAASPYDRRIDLFWAETTIVTDETMGWGTYAPEVVVHPVAGRHEELMAPPAVEVIGLGLRDLLTADDTRR